jgi:hypothetical protein
MTKPQSQLQSVRAGATTLNNKKVSSASYLAEQERKKLSNLEQMAADLQMLREIRDRERDLDEKIKILQKERKQV